MRRSPDDIQHCIDEITSKITAAEQQFEDLNSLKNKFNEKESKLKEILSCIENLEKRVKVILRFNIALERLIENVK